MTLNSACGRRYACCHATHGIIDVSQTGIALKHDEDRRMQEYKENLNEHVPLKSIV